MKTVLVLILGLMTSYAHATQFKHYPAYSAGWMELNAMFSAAEPLMIKDMPEAIKAGMCKSIVNNQLVVGHSAFVSTATEKGNRFGDYVLPDYPDRVDNGSPALYDSVLDQAQGVARTYAPGIRKGHLATIKAFPDDQALSRRLTINDVLIRWKKSDYGTYYPLIHPTLSRDYAIGYQLAMMPGEDSFVTRSEYRRTEDGMIIGAYRTSRASIWAKARDLEKEFINKEVHPNPTLFCFWYEDVQP